METLAEQPAQQNFVDWEQLEKQFEPQPISNDEKFLTEVDHLNANRLPDGSHSQWTLDEQFKNILSATKEAGMPYAVSKTEHLYQETGERGEQGRNAGVFMWLGRTAVEHAMSGRRYHQHPVALERVDIEVDEARDSANLKPGITKVFISPRMTRVDASHEEAKAEHLADDDSIRISEAVADEHGNIQKRVMESLLFRDIPLEAWVDFLNDPDNIFGKSIKVEDNGSATPVMKAHRELEIESDRLENGVISVVEAVIPYIKDVDLRKNARTQLGRFYENQEDMHDKAVNIAKRWQDFEVELADSLYERQATPAMKGFINSMQSKWGPKDLDVILKHQLPNAGYKMSRQLAAIIEKAQQNLLWTRAAIVTGNEKVIEQLDEETARQLYRDEMDIQVAADSGMYDQVRALEARSNMTIASHNVIVGGGCPGESSTDFNSDDLMSVLGSDVTSLATSGNKISGSKSGSSLESRVGKISKGKCVIDSCPTRPGEVKVGGCGVCLDRCQKLFDQGKDPSKTKKSVNNHEFSLAA